VNKSLKQEVIEIIKSIIQNSTELRFKNWKQFQEHLTGCLSDLLKDKYEAETIAIISEKILKEINIEQIARQEMTEILKNEFRKWNPVPYAFGFVIVTQHTQTTCKHYLTYRIDFEETKHPTEKDVRKVLEDNEIPPHTWGAIVNTDRRGVFQFKVIKKDDNFEDLDMDLLTVITTQYPHEILVD